MGFAASQDTYSVTEPDPAGPELRQGDRKRFERRRPLSQRHIDLFIPNGIRSARLGPQLPELNGLRKALGTELERVAFAPIKPQISYLGAGSGVDAAAAALSVSTGKVPPAKNTKKIIDGQKLNVSENYREMPVKVAVNTVYSLGGQNAAALGISQSC